jgi:polynucleotide 5'-hydroxyl-kinase GRC3/NOL9
MLAKLANTDLEGASITMICGPKSSGKSTFTRFLTNKLVLSTPNSQTMGVAILDLDPGQPEFSVPGQLSLTHLREPNFGPPFSHPKTARNSNTIRSHTIAAVSPSMDPNLYTACAIDLFEHYGLLLSKFPTCPLIINTPGWVLGTGLEILMELIARIGPREVIYMSEDGPREVVDSLKEAAKSTPLYILPSQASEYTTRTAAHLRTMQYMSYFHLNADVKKGLAWNNAPLTSIRPWEIHYSGENAGLLAIICYGEQPSANLLAETINGTLVSVVVLDDMSAMPGWKSRESNSKIQDQDESVDDSYVPLEDDTGIGVFDVDELHPISLTQPLIIQTHDEGLPYFNPENAISLNPRFSQAIGLALVRGIDVPRRKLQVLTSIDPSVIQEINEAGKKIALISGKLDTPGWAYTEELIQREMAAKQRRQAVESATSYDVVDDDAKSNEESTDTDDAFVNTPWVERLKGSQGRGVESRVWRVRRDLGKSTDGVP